MILLKKTLILLNFFWKNINWNRFVPLNSTNETNDSFLNYFSDLCDYFFSFPNKKIEIKSKHPEISRVASDLWKSFKKTGIWRKVFLKIVQ